MNDASFNPTALAAAAIPLLPLALALCLPGAARRAARVAHAAGWATFGLAAVAAAGTALGGAVQASALRLGSGEGAALSLGVYVDALTATMLLLVSFVGAIVVGYSRNYLDGDPGHRRFTRGLLLALSAVLALVVAGNVLLFALAWIATSVALHRLLVFYPQRHGAQLAARKKFVFSRIADACLLAAVVLIASSFRSLEFADVLSQARALAATGQPVVHSHLIALLLVAAALIKSAQLPFHGWLPEVMETPTPVSALLHAGIINAGGFLIVRMSPVVSASAPALDVLVLVGAFTALLAATVMLTQTSVKASLAWSTCAQMGFMLLQCGLGAFSTAVLHIVGHSLYKAHAFLSAGSVVDVARITGRTRAGTIPAAAALALVAAAVLLTAGAARAFGLSPYEHPGSLALAAIMTIGSAQLVAQSRARAGVLLWHAVGTAAVVCVAYLAFTGAFRLLLAGAVAPDVAAHSPSGLLLPAAVVATFALAWWLQSQLPALAARPLWRRLYVHLANGLYVNAWVNRRIACAWPVRPALNASAQARLVAQGEGQ
jgi:NAD(P)H-quinone oxidoreductase subunit 5